MIEKRMHILGDEIELPKGWKYKKIVDCCVTCFIGKSPKYSKKPTNNKVIGQAANQRYGIDLKFVKYVTDEFAQKQDDKFYLRYKDVLLNTLGTGSIGRAGIYKHTEKMLTDGHPFVFRTGEKCIPEYLYYYFVLNEQNIINSASGSTNQKFLKLKEFTELEIPVPQIDEQKRIVDYIETMFSSLDNAVETLNKTKEQLAVYRLSVFKKAFQRNLVDTITTEKKLGDYIEKPKYGTSKKCDYDVEKKSIGVFRIPNIDALNGTMDYEDIKYAVFEEKELDKLDLQDGDLLMIRSNGSPSIVGTVAMIREKDTAMTFAGYLMRLRIKNKAELFPKYLRYYFSSLDARFYIECVAKSTSGVNNINAQEIANLPFPYMQPEKQKNVIFEIESRLSVYDTIEKSVGKALRQVKSIKQSILIEAFEGRLA